MGAADTVQFLSTVAVTVNEVVAGLAAEALSATPRSAPAVSIAVRRLRINLPNKVEGQTDGSCSLPQLPGILRFQPRRARGICRTSERTRADNPALAPIMRTALSGPRRGR